jgi:hypothetical protein
VPALLPQVTIDPQSYICSTYNCCPACDNPDPACADNGPVTGPSLEFFPEPSTCSPTPPPVNVKGEASHFSA